VKAISVYDTPEAGFLPSSELIYTYQPVAFTPMNTETITLTYTWNFGDGTGDFREADPITKIHKFTRSGWYTVTLTTSNEYCTGVASMSIYVNPLIYLPVTLNMPDWRLSPTDLGRGD
jgi:PKD repeat protein